MIVVDRRGRLVADSAGEGLGRASYAGRPEIATALRGRTAQGTRRSESLDQDLLYTAVPIMRGARPAGAVRVTQSVAAVQSEMRSDALALIGIGAVVLALGLALAWFLADSIAKPAARPRGRCARRRRRGPATARRSRRAPGSSGRWRPRSTT